MDTISVHANHWCAFGRDTEDTFWSWFIRDFSWSTNPCSTRQPRDCHSCDVTYVSWIPQYHVTSRLITIRYTRRNTNSRCKYVQHYSTVRYRVSTIHHRKANRASPTTPTGWPQQVRTTLLYCAILRTDYSPTESRWKISLHTYGVVPASTYNTSVLYDTAHRLFTHGKSVEFCLLASSKFNAGYKSKGGFFHFSLAGLLRS